jgi:hypothetical protein
VVSDMVFFDEKSENSLYDLMRSSGVDMKLDERLGDQMNVQILRRVVKRGEGLERQSLALK